MLGLGINPALVGTLQAIPRLTDAMTDPIWYISDNTDLNMEDAGPITFS